jgi:hypothetical protein
MASTPPLATLRMQTLALLGLVGAAHASVRQGARASVMPSARGLARAAPRRVATQGGSVFTQAVTTADRGIARAAPRMVATLGGSVFTQAVTTADRAALKQQILQLGAALDRGQSFNPTSGEYYAERIEAAKERIDALIALAGPPITSLEQLQGEWELVFTNVQHGIFRSSPFFLAVQEAYSKYSEGGEPTGVDKVIAVRPL